MKTTYCIRCVLLPLIFLLGKTSQAQFVLEHDYPNSVYSLKYVNFRFNGEKYVRLNYPRYPGQDQYSYTANPSIDIYNLDHSLWKTISLSTINFPEQANSTCIMYVSDGLFNNDSLIEFLYTYWIETDINDTARPIFATFVYNENLDLLFTDSISGPYYISNEIPASYVPIINTSEGTKMILSSGYPSYMARVYGLQGVLTDVASLQDNGTSTNGQPVSPPGLNLRPNPAHNYTTVQYQLPDDIPTAQLVFYNLSGQRIKSFTVDHTFTDLQVSTTDLASGAYYCELETPAGILTGKKLIKIN